MWKEYVKAKRIWYTRCNMKFRWQNSSPRNVIAIQLLISAGKNTSDLSLMIISRSESRNSRTRFKFVFEEKTSRSYIYITSQKVSEFKVDARGVFKNRTSMIFWCFNSRRYFTSRIADMSKPSLNWPTFIFLIATFLPVEASLPTLKPHS